MPRTLYPVRSIPGSLRKSKRAPSSSKPAIHTIFPILLLSENKVLRLIIARHYGGVNELLKISNDFRPNECSVMMRFFNRHMHESAYIYLLVTPEK